ncbi:MAG: radical SAM protein, partial [Bacteroidetes bacterium]|nr:radical SAM protein [Bacteroidota bacterium]
QGKIFSPSKVATDHEKIEAYIKGDRIYPTTIEMDLTQLCTRSCPGCPYSVSRRPGLTLQLPFLDRLFSILGPHTPGIVLSGGEATLVPHFPETVALAKKKGFQQIAVISNGGNIHQEKVIYALLENVTAIRVSMYDWQEKEAVYFTASLKKIENLRNYIEKEGSPLEIGASILTRKEWNHRYKSVGLRALSAGIDWLYFHPYCVDWDKGFPVQADQAGVLEAISDLQKYAPKYANIQVPYERYSEAPLYFEKLHGSHFLIQVGADGINYAGPECKYEKETALLNLNDYMEDDFLWHPQRLKMLDELNSDNYRFIGTKHRPVIFSDHLQKVIKSAGNEKEKGKFEEPPDNFSYPNII